MSTTDKFSAGDQSLGYTYQARFALLQLLRLPEETAILIEKDDDLDFVDEAGSKSLASLKHKATGERLTDLSVDFWKSINIWLTRYKRDGCAASFLRFFLFTTAAVSEKSFLSKLTANGERKTVDVVNLAHKALAATTSAVILPIKADFDALSELEKQDFLERIYIFDHSPRIEDIPAIVIDQHMRTIQKQFRVHMFESLEGWWNDVVIRLLTGMRTTEVYSREVSDKLAAISDEYKTDNLPIGFRRKTPEGGIDPHNDPRLFVTQLRELGLKAERIESAILDYYRAFQQRASWARQHVLLDGEVDDYEDRLVDEWGRTRNVVFEELNDTATEDVMTRCGRELYKWAEMNTDHLRIRDRVSEPYVVRGSLHILANARPLPKVYWHPLFLERLNSALTKPAE
jgi:hypothetical protein